MKKKCLERKATKPVGECSIKTCLEIKKIKKK